MSVVFVVFGEKPSSVTAVQMYSSIIPVVAQGMDMNKQVHVFFCFNFNACSPICTGIRALIYQMSAV